EAGGDRLYAKALAAARDAHHEEALGHDLAGQLVAHLEEALAFDQPFLEAFESADFAEVRAVGDVIDDAAAADEGALLFEHVRYGVRAQARIDGEGAAQRVPGFIEREAEEGARELLDECVVRAIETVGGEKRRFLADEVDEFGDVGRAEFEEDDATFDFLGDLAHGR